MGSAQRAGNARVGLPGLVVEGFGTGSGSTVISIVHDVFDSYADSHGPGLPGGPHASCISICRYSLGLALGWRGKSRGAWLVVVLYTIDLDFRYMYTVRTVRFSLYAPHRRGPTVR